MTRYFFDFKSRNQSFLDYKGEEFRAIENACQYAEEIALDLKHSLNAEWVGWSVEVFNATGQKLFSLPVAAAELVSVDLRGSATR